eukprot:TRINITY_DN2086_c0_g1_i1.p1 TRINITY_DN2086_c0_g1~~TRINITY_DN2086_c0_g1_i1.p1  ORF type:complete len:519 (+),score=132.62 TRINITY_DN2086_c0_g1_i1:28-1584(+)
MEEVQKLEELYNMGFISLEELERRKEEELSKVEELYRMGFIPEPEYLSRKQLLVGSKGTATGNQPAVETPSYGQPAPAWETPSYGQEVKNTTTDSPTPSNAVPTSKPKAADLPGNTNTDYQVYGKDVCGVVIYHTSRSGTFQTPLLPSPFSFESIYTHLSIPPSTNYYLQDVFDSKKKCEGGVVPDGQYYLKENRKPLLRERPMTCESSMFHPTFYKYEIDHLAKRTIELVAGQIVNTDAPSWYTDSIEHLYNPIDNINDVCVLSDISIYYFPRNTTIGGVFKRLGVSAGCLEKRANEFYSDLDFVLPVGRYKYRKAEGMSVATSTRAVSVMKSKYDNPLMKDGKYVSVNPDPPMNRVVPRLTHDQVKAALEANQAHPTPKGKLIPHFIYRVRWLQANKGSVGSLQERLEKNLCLVSGKEVNTGHVNEEYYDQTLEDLIQGLKENGLWEGLFSEKVTLEKGGPRDSDEEEIEREQNKPLITLGEQFYTPENKFQYITPYRLSEYITARPSLFSSTSGL